MDINHIINIVKDIPVDRWNDEATIKSVIKNAAEQSGRTYSEEELKQYVTKFKKFAGDRSAISLIPLLLKKGISKNQLDDIIKKIN